MGTVDALFEGRQDHHIYRVAGQYGEKEYVSSSSSRPEIASISLSCRLPSTGPYKLAMMSLGVTTGWNSMAGTLLFSL